MNSKRYTVHVLVVEIDELGQPVAEISRYSLESAMSEVGIAERVAEKGIEYAQGYIWDRPEDGKVTDIVSLSDAPVAPVAPVAPKGRGLHLDTQAYEYSHGKKPSGYGLWMFKVKAFNEAKRQAETHELSFTGTLTDCRANLAVWFLANGLKPSLAEIEVLP